MHLFYQPLHKNGDFRLENEEFFHCVKVLRHQLGDTVWITDGQGLKIKARISAINKQELIYHPLEVEEVRKKPFHVHLMIAPTKQMERMEWMVEKACELGVDRITFIRTANSERPRIKTERLEKKAIAALKQSKSAFKTSIEAMSSMESAISGDSQEQQFIAVVKPDLPHITHQARPGLSTSVLIGPEGDFTHLELEWAVQQGFQPVALSHNVLRTETAGILSIALINAVNGY